MGQKTVEILTTFIDNSSKANNLRPSAYNDEQF